MTRREKLLARILSGQADGSIAFSDLRTLLAALGFEERQRGSHHVFRRPGVGELVNLQKDGKHAKPYQVRQVRSVIVKYRLGDKSDG